MKFDHATQLPHTEQDADADYWREQSSASAMFSHCVMCCGTGFASSSHKCSDCNGTGRDPLAAIEPTPAPTPALPQPCTYEPSLEELREELQEVVARNLKTVLERMTEPQAKAYLNRVLWADFGLTVVRRKGRQFGSAFA